MGQERLNYLFENCYRQVATPAERDEFLQMVALPEYEGAVNELLETMFSAAKEVQEPNEQTSTAILTAIFDAAPVKKVVPMAVQKSPFTRSVWLRYAAVFILLLGIGVYAWMAREKSAAELAAGTGINTLKDISPGGNKAILTLSDGRTIVLDSAANGSLAQQGNIRIIKLTNGQLAYQTGTSNEALSGVEGSTERSRVNTPKNYNTITTPKGGQYQVQLPDGTDVWLNAASSIRFPTVFTATDRKVEITGEVYFEVAKDTRKPFYVSTPAQELKVLGTHFNINAYSDETFVKTTLLEGSVSIKSRATNKLVLLKPLQQSKIAGTGQLEVTNDIDAEDVMAWKNGLFSFQGAGIEQVMRQLARWYNVEVRYEGAIPQRSFVGKIGRNYNLSDVLTVLQASDVHFSIVNNTIVIKK